MTDAKAMRLTGALATFLLVPTMASAQTVTAAGPQFWSLAIDEGEANTASSRDAEGHPDLGATAVLTEDDLAANRGGETIVAGNQTLIAVTTGNVLNGNYNAGSVVLSDQALSNFNGIGNFAINTGAQVSIQSGLNLTINVGQ